MSFANPNTIIDIPDATDAFSDYYAEFSSLISSSNRAISTATSSSALPPTEDAASLDDADRCLQEASDLLKAMELEAQAHDPSKRDSLRVHVANCRSDVIRVKKELRAARITVAQRRSDSNRASLFGDGNSDLESGSLDQRAHMLDTTQKLERGSEMILESRRNIAETESIGASILEDLQSQRNTISRARDNLGNVDTGIDQSNSLISTMHRRAMMNKIIVYVVLAIVGMACLGIIYARIFHPRVKQ